MFLSCQYKLFYYIDAHEILAFSSEIKTGILQSEIPPWSQLKNIIERLTM